MRTAVAAVLAWYMAGTPALAQDDLPDTTDDGLERVESKQIDALYWRPGASLAPYERINILDCFVAFRKDWERDQNEGRRGVERVEAEDMQRIRMLLAEEFSKVFTRELEERGGYQIVDEVGDDVLLLRPAIVNLDVAAPDLRGPGRVDSYTASAGAMTLYMELYDSATSAIIGRVVDQREGMDTGMFQIANEVTNRAEADRILRSWATTLHDALDDQWSGDR